MKKSELKTIIKEELKHMLLEDKGVTATQLVAILNKESGENFKVNFGGAWDTYTVKTAKEITANRGLGFEKAILVKGPDGGSFIYFGPFKIDTLPSSKEMLLFYADEAFYMKGI